MRHQLETDQLTSDLLVDLFDQLRPQDVSNRQDIHDKIQTLIYSLTFIPDAAATCQLFLLKLLNQYKQVSLYAESGILSPEGFPTQLANRIGAHVLPLLKDESELKYLVGKVFHQSTDVQWLETIAPQDWQDILALLCQPQSYVLQKKQIRVRILQAIQTLSYRISAIGLHPELQYIYPALNELTSPFLIQNREILDFLDHYQKFDEFIDDDLNIGPQIANLDPDQALVMLDQCREVMQKVRRLTKRQGVSLSLTYLLTVLEQSLERIELLLSVVSDQVDEQQLAIKQLLFDLVDAHYSDQSVRALLQTNTELLALQMTENASRTGEHYVSTDKSGYFKMYRSAAGAGAIIATMATLKVLMSRVTMAPFMQAFAYSMNYSLGFVLIHMLHFTVATKQPAMTAAALAATIQNSTGSQNAKLAETAALIINIGRTQFIAIIGNISIAIPVAALICWLWPILFSEQLVTNIKAMHLLNDLNPFTSMAIPHAAIAGVCLFLSGLITGYYDNLAVYRKIGARISAHPKLRKIFKLSTLDRIASYIECNLGAIMGNFLFGIMLGSMGTLGFILGLPLDIRHIAFASANLIQGLLNLSGGADLGIIIISVLGVMLIGITNLFVSFSLTIIVALRSRRVKVKQWKPLFKLIITHFATRPSDFFWPPKQPLQIEEQNKP
ncbi:recombinase [Acinetobacter qingfengensis]|uniref:Recombinase n=2 Tax=Acinetobacter qingfengensis TaxID=1262585 RepID=A0A1E7RFP0_9GAMM|nr:recombinase [Acinetobacter qingfengensis]OEY98210.1 recombinase [Acinetobacter qingfengensis]